MTNLFLKVDKDWFKLGLNPTEILIIAQIAEFQRNTGDCFISDKVLAEMLNVSEKTISRTLKGLEDNGFITRITKNIKGGKERHMSVNFNKINETLSTDKMSLEDAQETKSPLSTDNLSIDNRQNDLIKDKLKDKEKDNLGASSAPIVAEKAPEVIPEGEVKEMAFEEFKKEFANDLCVADTSQFQSHGIVKLYGKTYKLYR